MLTDSKVALQSLTSDVLQTRRPENSMKACYYYYTSALQSYSGSQLTVGFQEMTAADRLAMSATKHIHIPGGKDPAPQQTEDRMEGTTQPTIPSTSSRDRTTPPSSGYGQATMDYELG